MMTSENNKIEKVAIQPQFSRIKEVLNNSTGNQKINSYVGKTINVEGNKPVVDFDEFHGGLYVSADILFCGEFLEEYDEEQEPIARFYAEEWEILGPITKNQYLPVPENYLNIFGYLQMTQS